jgi:hypothetical protein
LSSIRRLALVVLVALGWLLAPGASAAFASTSGAALLQFTAGDSVLGFEPGGLYVGAPDHLLAHGRPQGATYSVVDRGAAAAPGRTRRRRDALLRQASRTPARPSAASAARRCLVSR